jgi:hypothetical protein
LETSNISNAKNNTINNASISNFKPNHKLVDSNPKLNTEINDNNTFFAKAKNLKDASFSNLSVEPKDINAIENTPQNDSEIKERINAIEGVVHIAPKLILEVHFVINFR